MRREHLTATNAPGRAGGIVAGLWWCACAGTAAAEAPDERVASAAPSALEEIVVTARRREERLRDVPVSVSVRSGRDLGRQQIEDLAALQYSVPSLTVTPFPGSPARATIAMRGQLEADLFPTLDPAVGVYLDGVYIARSSGANLDIVDMQRVEVLRGPQGTLFGRNTIGGAINLVPVRPGAELEGEVMIGGGNYDRRDFRAILNLPSAGGTYATRLAVSHTEHDGYGRNVRLGSKLNKEDTDFLRAQLRLMPAERWDLNLAFDLTRTDEGRNLLTMLAVFPPLTAIPAMAGNPDDQLENYQDATARNVHGNRLGTSSAEVRGFSGALEFAFPGFVVKAISAWRSLDSGSRDADLDGTPYDLFTVLERDEHQWQVSHELQAWGDARGGRLHWIGGLLWFDESTDFSQRVRGVVPTTLTFLDLVTRGTARNDSVAAYAELAYAVTPKLRATAGVRYNEDGRQLTSSNARGTGGIDACTLDLFVRDEPGACRATLPEREFSYLPWTLGVDFTPTQDVLVYARINRGFRAGGYNMRGTNETDLDTFDPERLTAFEIGGRASLAGDRLWLGIALFRSVFDAVQLRQQVPVPNSPITLRLTQNGGKARVDGGELEMSALLGRLRLAGTLGIVDARYTRLDPRVEGVTLDSDFLQTPVTTASLALDLPVAAGPAELHLHADYSWRSEQAFAYDRNSLARQGPYGLANAMISARFGGGRLELALWGRNLLDERYLLRAVDIGPLVTAIPGDPRTVGASFTWRFAAR